MRPLRRIIVHHSESPGGDAAMIREWHTTPSETDPTKPWSDIGYHYVITNGKPHGDYSAGRDGEVQPGRRLRVQGAHAGGHNRDSIGVCLIGCFNEARPTHRQTRSLMELCLRLCERWGIPHSEVYGHRDVNATNCPGDNLFTQLPFVRTWLKWRMR